jgi:hypothetical protein
MSENKIVANSQQPTFLKALFGVIVSGREAMLKESLTFPNLQ